MKKQRFGMYALGVAATIGVVAVVSSSRTPLQGDLADIGNQVMHTANMVNDYLQPQQLGVGTATLEPLPPGCTMTGDTCRGSAYAGFPPLLCSEARRKARAIVNDCVDTAKTACTGTFYSGEVRYEDGVEEAAACTYASAYAIWSCTVCAQPQQP